MNAALLALFLAPGVAPWDVPDAPNPYPGLSASSPLVSDPPKLAHTDSAKVVLPNGINVQLMAVGRRGWGRETLFRNTLPDAQPAWNTDGSPYLGTGPTEKPLEGVLTPHPTGGLMTDPQAGKEFDDKGARYLAFRLTGQPGAAVDLYGYVPQTAHRGEPRPERHGRDVPVSLALPSDGRLDYETEIVVDDRTAVGYRLAYATGEWKTVAAVTVDSAKAAGVSTLAHGEWGELRQDARALDRVREAQKESLRKNGFAIGPSIPPYATYTVAFPEPPKFATRLRLTDRFGETFTLPRSLGTYGSPGDSGNFRWPAVRVEVQARPYSWVEFSNVRYDPDPSKWPVAYWGAEGEKAASQVDGATLRAIVDPTFQEGKLTPTHVYAPDGTLWRDFPDPSSVSWPWIVDKDMPGKLLAHLRIIPAQASGQSAPDLALIQTYASQSDVPGKGLLEELAAPRWGGESTLIPFARPASHHVQFRVSRSLPWKKVGEIAPPTSLEIDGLVKTLMAKKDIAKDPHGRIFDAFLVIADAEGKAGYWTHDNVLPGRLDTVTWPVREPGTKARVVIHMRSGESYIEGMVIANLATAKSAGPWFGIDEKGKIFCETWQGTPQRAVRVSLRDVAAFEIETQDYAPPVYLVAKVPLKG